MGDPIAEGLVTSLARPGDNVTGLSNVTNDLVGKWLELLKQVVPGVSLIAVLRKPDSMPEDAKKVRLKEIDVSGRALGVQLQVVEARGPADFDKAFSEMSAKGAGALVVLTTPVFDIERQRIVDLAAKTGCRRCTRPGPMSRLGALCPTGRTSLICIGAPLPTWTRYSRAQSRLTYLSSNRPSSRLVINLKTAKTSGLTVPPTLLAQADDVIE